MRQLSETQAGVDARLIFVSAVAVVTLFAVSSLAVEFASVTLHRPLVGTPASRLVTSATSLEANRGRVVFSDDFHDSRSGWVSTTEAAGTTFYYSGGRYVVVAMGDFNHPMTSPYKRTVRQVGVSVTATQSTDAPNAAGFGVMCRRGSGRSQVRYEFFIHAGHYWSVQRRDGVGGASVPFILKQGTAPSVPGASPVTVVGICGTLRDGQTTRLAMFVDGALVVDIVDIAPNLPAEGWLAGLVVTSRASKASTVTFSRFEERDLGR